MNNRLKPVSISHYQTAAEPNMAPLSSTDGQAALLHIDFREFKKPKKAEPVSQPWVHPAAELFKPTSICGPRSIADPPVLGHAPKSCALALADSGRGIAVKPL